MPRPERLLAGGFYTPREASRILGIESEQRIRDWLKGRTGHTHPVIERQYAPISHAEELGFFDLLEIRFVAYFRRQGVSLQSIRRAAERARNKLKVLHPFAMSSARFVTDRKCIFLQTAKETGDQTLLDLTRGQFAMYDMIEQILDKGITFDPASGLAERWHPYLGEYPNVVLDPLIAYGHPVVEGANIPTETLFRQWQAEEHNFSVVADWFEVDIALVQQAVEYELRPE